MLLRNSTHFENHSVASGDGHLSDALSYWGVLAGQVSTKPSGDVCGARVTQNSPQKINNTSEAFRAQTTLIQVLPTCQRIVKKAKRSLTHGPLSQCSY